MRTHRDEQAEDSGSGSSRAAGDEPDTYSAGEAHGDGKGVGHASIKTEIALESEGALRDVWNAMQHLKRLYPNAVKSVEWYKPSEGFSQSETPELVALESFKHDETFEDGLIPTGLWNWPYMDPATRNELRGLLVARISLSGTYVHIIEIQRRPCRRKGADGVIADSEEELYDWFKFVRSHVRRVKGVVHKLTRHCPGKADSFRHVASSNEEVACWAALKNALRKVDIQLN